MEKVGISELKNSLSSYIERVSRGTRFLVTDHNRPVAKLTPIDDGETKSLEEKAAALIASGVIQCLEPDQRLEKTHSIKIDGVSATAVLLGMRD